MIAEEAGSSGGARRALAGGVLVALVAAGLFFQGLGRYPLCDPDEARHAEVAREMAAARGWKRLFLPTLELRPYREKPPGWYWLVAATYRTAGVGAGAARLPGALASWLAVLALYAWAVPRAGVAGAAAGALVLATSAGWFGLARYATLDMTFAACTTIGVLAGLAWLERPPPHRPPVAPYVAAALAVLVKGPLGAVLVAGPLALATWMRRPRPSVAELGLPRGLALAGAIVAAQVVPIVLLDPDTALGLVAANLRRFATDSPHAAPAVAYALWLPALFLPWTVFAAVPLAAAARDPRRRPLVAWAAFVPAVLSLARGKLPTYALPALPPLALVLGPALVDVVRRVPSRAGRWWLRAAAVVVATALGGAAVAAVAAGRPYPIGGAGRAALAVVALGWAAVAGAVGRSDDPERLPVVVLGAVLTLLPLGVRTVVPAVAALHSDRDAAALVRAAGGGPTIAFGSWARSLVFYTETPTVRTDDVRVARDLFADAGPTFLVTGPGHFTEVEAALGARAHVWHATPRRRLYANRPPP